MRDSPASPPAKGESPKRMVIREIAQSPTAASISREMTLSELTHAYHHLADQAEKDKTWTKAVEHAITDHAIWIDRSICAFKDCQKQIEGMRAARVSLPSAALSRDGLLELRQPQHVALFLRCLSL